MNFALTLLLSLNYALAFVPGHSSTQTESGVMPKEFENVGIEPKLGENLDMNLAFKDEAGNTVLLGDYFNKGKPVVISLIYYSCPGLCNFHLNGFIDGLKGLDWQMSEQFTYLVISFDAKETPELAAKKKQSYLDLYGREGVEGGWHFLTGEQSAIDQLTKAVGFKYNWVEESKEWAHASAAMIATPEGKLSRYLFGIFFEPQDIKLALNEAGDGKVGTLVDRLMLFCFQFDPTQKKYVLYSYNLMRLAAAVTAALVGMFLFLFWFRSRRQGIAA